MSLYMRMLAEVAAAAARFTRANIIAGRGKLAPRTFDKEPTSCLVIHCDDDQVSLLSPYYAALACLLMHPRDERTQANKHACSKTFQNNNAAAALKSAASRAEGKLRPRGKFARGPRRFARSL